jgi:asparagine synthase (glutamine-hydrolysing)
MCGIWTLIELIKKSSDYNKLFQDFMNTKHRGPDTSSFQIIKNVMVGFHRLAIMDPTFHANQPYIIEDGERTIIFTCNGEIYNFKELINKFELSITTNSDCLTIPKLYIKTCPYNSDGKTDVSNFVKLFARDIKGEFAFVLLEFDKLQNLKQVIAGRDQIGVRPLYYNNVINDDKSCLLFSSEIKGMTSLKDKVSEFEPGTIQTFNLNDFGKLTNIDIYNFKIVYSTNEILQSSELSENVILGNIRNAVINSVKRRLMSDRPIAFLLSGGVDSSLVAAISAKILGQSIKTYCCGMKAGTDLMYAKMVADHIGSNHTEVFFTEKEGLDAIDDVIRTTETWDTTTIRASVGQYLVCKHIGTKTDARVVMVGEGPDEVCSSYLFNFNAPNGEMLHDAAKEYVEKIHMFDGKRADRCISRWGLEGRIALLDPEFIEAYWAIPAKWRHPKYKGIEKWWLRKAFEGTGILPDQVLWRKKEAFSDGVSGKEKSWFEIIQDHIKSVLPNKSQDELNASSSPSLEAYYYKQKFISYFGHDRLSIIPHYWQPKWTGNNGYIDPSARVLNIYNNDIKEPNNADKILDNMIDDILDNMINKSPPCSNINPNENIDNIKHNELEIKKLHETIFVCI